MDAKTAFQTPWFSVAELAPNQPANPMDGPYYCLHTADGVISVVLTDAGDLVMVRQFRQARQRITLECPAGGIDPGEDPQTAVAREVCEETGHVCAHWALLGSGSIYPNRNANTEYLFLGIGARPVASWQPEPRVETVVVPRAQFVETVLGDEFEQIAVFGALQLADLRLGCRVLHDPIDVIEARVLAAAAAPVPSAMTTPESERIAR